jgi:hypothetical protein
VVDFVMMNHGNSFDLDLHWSFSQTVWLIGLSGPYQSILRKMCCCVVVLCCDKLWYQLFFFFLVGVVTRSSARA